MRHLAALAIVAIGLAACAFAAWAMLFLTATLAAAAAFLGKSPTQLFKSN